MKNKINLFLLFSLLILTASCSKKISDDNPLPKYYSASVLAPTDNNQLICLDVDSGFKKWEYQKDGAFNYNTCVSLDPTNNIAYFGSPITPKTFYALDLKTGIVKWEKNLDSPDSLSVPLFANNQIYRATKDTMYCLNTDNSIKWRNKITSGLSSFFGNNPTYSNGKITVMYGTTLYNINANNGNVNWSYPVANGVPNTPTVVNDITYLTTDSKSLLAISSTGVFLWSYTTPENITTSPCVYGGMCIFGCDDNKIYAIDAVSGTPRWPAYTTAEKVQSSAAIDTANENIIIGSNDFNLYAINHVNGTLRWKYPTGSLILSSPIVYNGNIFVSGYDKYIYCINGKTGTLKWKYYLGCTLSGSPVVNGFDGTSAYPGISGNTAY